MWSWILEGIGIAGSLIVGRKHYLGWVVLLFNTCLWATYGLKTHQYGFTGAALMYAPVYSRNLYRWYKQHKK